MKHSWEYYTPNNLYQSMSSYGHRKCTLCGKTQSKESVEDWMRVVGYRWRPLIGRCKGNEN